MLHLNVRPRQNNVAYCLTMVPAINVLVHPLNFPRADIVTVQRFKGIFNLT